MPHLHYEAALFLEGREMMRGNRSRVVFLANVLSDKLKDAQGPLDLVVLRAAAPPKARVGVSWRSLHAGNLRFYVCFGGVRLRWLQLGTSCFEAGLCDDLRVEGGANLRLELENPQGTHAQAMAALIFERTCTATWLLRDRDPVFAPASADERSLRPSRGAADVWPALG